MRFFCTILLFAAVLAAGCGREAPAPTPPSADVPAPVEPQLPPGPPPEPVAPEPEPEPEPVAARLSAPVADIEPDLRRIRAMADAADFNGALIAARELKIKRASHPKRNDIALLIRELVVLRRHAQEARFAIRNLGSDSYSSALAARSALRSPTGAARILMRRAAAEEENEAVARQVVHLLGYVEDTNSVPVLQSRLLRELERPTMRAALLDSLAEMPDAIQGPFLDHLLRIVQEDGAYAQRDLADLLLRVLDKKCELSAQAFDDLLEQPGAAFILKTHTGNALSSTNSAIAAWGFEKSVAAGLYLRGLRGQYFAGTDFESLRHEQLDSCALIPESKYPFPDGRHENVSVRWTGFLIAPRLGEYTITSASDDGQRVAVDGKLLIDDWNAHGVEERSAKISLSRGVYSLRVEHMQGGGPGAYMLSWAGPGITKQVVSPEYLMTPPWKNMPTDATVVRAESLQTLLAVFVEPVTPAIRRAALRLLEPSVNEIEPQYLVALLKRVNSAPVFGPAVWSWAELLCIAYAHRAQFSDDAFDALVRQPGAAAAIKTRVRAARDSDDAAASAWAERQPVLMRPGIRGSYYEGMAFEKLKFERLDTKIDIPELRFGYPDGRTENLSIRWTGFLRAPAAGNYRIYSLSDDGQRLWLDGKLVIDNWVMQGPTEASAELMLSAGSHALKIEYMQGTGGGTIRFSWDGPGIEKRVVGQDQLRTHPWPGMTMRK